MKAGAGYAWSVVFKKKENSLEDFYINRFGSGLYKMFFKDYTEKVWGKDPSELSATWGAQRVKGLSLTKAILAFILKPLRNKGVLKNNVETSLIEEFIYPKKGPGQLWETMADAIVENGGKIIFNSEVEKIVVVDGKIDSVYCKIKGENK